MSRKTNGLLRIFATFLLSATMSPLVAAVRESGWRAGDGDRALPSGTVVRFVDRGTNEAAAMTMLRFMDRELERLFRAPALHGQAGCRVVVSPLLAPEKILVRRIGQNVELTVGSRFPETADWQWRRQLASQLLAARYGVDSGERQLPDWIGAGMEHSWRSRRSSGKLVRNVYYYPLLRALLADDKAPDWRAIVGISTDKWDGVMRESYEELARVVMEVLAGISSLSDNALGDYAVAMLTDGKSEAQILAATLERRLRSARNGYSADGAMRLLMERAAFNGTTPYPGEVASRRLANILHFEYSSATRKDLTAKMKGSFLDLPRLFAEKHREAELIRSRMVADLREWERGAPRETLPPCEKLIGLLGSINTIQTESQMIGMRQAAEELQTVLDRQTRLDLALDAAERWTLSPYLAWRRELLESRNANDGMTRRVQEFLLRTEADYLDE